MSVVTAREDHAYAYDPVFFYLDWNMAIIAGKLIFTDSLLC